MKCKCEAKIFFEAEPNLGEAIYRCMAQESDDPHKGVDIKVERSRRYLCLTVAAGNIVSLRSALNTGLRLIKVIEDMIDIIDGGDLNG
ncbi:MAG: Transcription factor Pcc1 [Candidatus Methanolliviera sp. GoM_asphalt]|nr:MAG: Transcription factor Pcc1 [Candidatus Methanolliviera sp. GoM_asphalt]